MKTIEEPNYTNYTLPELEAAYDRIDREKFPERFECIKNEIAKRTNQPSLNNASLNEKPVISKKSGQLVYIALGFGGFVICIFLGVFIFVNKYFASRGLSNYPDDVQQAVISQLNEEDVSVTLISENNVFNLSVEMYVSNNIFSDPLQREKKAKEVMAAVLTIPLKVNFQSLKIQVWTSKYFGIYKESNEYDFDYPRK